MLIVRALLALTLLAFCVGAISQEPSPTPLETTGKPESEAKQQETKAEPDKRGTKDSPAIVEISKSPVIQVETTDKTEKHRDYSSSEWWVVYITGALAVITFFLALYTARLWASTRQIVVDAERNAQIQLRAYVCVKGGTIEFNNPASPVAEVQITNFGQTPAYNVRQWIHIWIEEHPLSVELPVAPHGFGQTDAVLAPGNSIFMVMPKEPPVPEESVHLLGTPEGTIYVYGRIEYLDVFRKSRWTNFRLMHGGREPTYNSKGLKPDTDGNDTSES